MAQGLRFRLTTDIHTLANPDLHVGSGMKPLILVVDGDVASRHALRVGLQSSGCDVSVLYSPAKVLHRVERERPSLILMSSATAGNSGALTVLNALRAMGDEVPVIMPGDVDDVTERIVALDCGSDDTRLHFRSPEVTACALRPRIPLIFDLRIA